MAEFTGEMFIKVTEQGDYHSGQYVDWLEARIEELEKEVLALSSKMDEIRKEKAELEQRLAASSANVQSLYRQVEYLHSTARSRWEHDYDSLPYEDDRDR